MKFRFLDWKYATNDALQCHNHIYSSLINIPDNKPELAHKLPDEVVKLLMLRILI